jgi:hypothetical protein
MISSSASGSQYKFKLWGSESGALTSKHANLSIDIAPYVTSKTISWLTLDARTYYVNAVDSILQDVINTSMNKSPFDMRQKYGCLPVVKLIHSQHSGRSKITEILV